MLDYLLPSHTRRRLLQALFLDAHRGTVSSLSRRARVSTAAARLELHAMHQAGLAHRSLDSGRRVYEAATDHPHAPTVRALLKLPAGAAALTPERGGSAPASESSIRNDLAALGADLPGHRVAVRPSIPPEQALARGVVLSHDDPGVARALPALFIKHRAELDHERLTAALHELAHKHSAGFLIAIAAQLSDDPELAARAEALRDRRRTRTVEYFSPRAAPKLAADQMTMPLALEWHFHFPWPLATFPS